VNTVISGIGGDSETLVLSYEGPGIHDGFPAITLVLSQGNRTLAFFEVVAGAYTGGVVRQQGDLRWSEQLVEALLLHGIARLEAEVGELGGLEALTAQSVHTWVVGADEAEFIQLFRLTSEKSCDYQIRDGPRDLLCSAAGRGDETRVGEVGSRPVAPTSRALCRACNLPDTSYICSHLLRPEVYAVSVDQGILHREVVGAMCDLGYSEASTAPADCRPGGHGCWQRLIEPRATRNPDVTPPLSLPEAFDFLDAVWRNWVGKNLMGHVAATHLAGLIQPVSGAEDFRCRLDDVADVLDSWRVPAVQQLVGKGPAKSATLQRLRAYLTFRLDDEGSKSRVGQAIAVLEAVNRIRAAGTHSQAVKNLPVELAKLGIPYPPVWSEAWDILRSRLVSCLAVLRDEVRRQTSLTASADE